MYAHMTKNSILRIKGNQHDSTRIVGIGLEAILGFWNPFEFL